MPTLGSVMLGPITATTAKPPFADGGARLANKETDPDDTNIWRDGPDRSVGFVRDCTKNAAQPRAVTRRKNPWEVQTKFSD